MNVTRKQIDDLNAVVTIEVTPTDYSDKVNKVLEDYRRNAKIPGFRPGKVPAGMIKKQYGRAVAIDEINRLLQDSIFEYIQKENLDILGNPIPVPKNDINWDDPETLSFEFEIGLTPQFEVPVNKKVKVPHYTVRVDDKALDREIESITRRYGKMSEPEVLGTEDILTGTFQQIDAKGQIVEGGLNEDARFVVKELKSAKKREEALKLTPEVTLDIDPNKDFSPEFNVEGMLSVTSADLKAMKALRFTFKSAYRIEPAELTPELFEKVLGKKEATTEQEFRALLRTEMERVYRDETKIFFLNQASDILMEKTKFDLPGQFLKKWMRTAGEEPLSEEQVEEQWETTAKGLKWQLIENKVVKDNHLHVHKEELEAFAANYVRERMSSMGQGEIDDEHVQSIAKNLLDDQEQAQGMSDRILNDKMIAFFKENFKLDEKSISYTDFVKLVNEQK